MRRLPVLRFLVLGLIILVGIGLFLALSPRATPMVTPSGMETEP